MVKNRVHPKPLFNSLKPWEIEYIIRTVSFSEVAYEYAKELPEWRDKLKHKVSKEWWMFRWADNFGTNVEFMKNKLKKSNPSSCISFKWAANIGNPMEMREHVEAIYWKKTWNGHFDSKPDFDKIGFHDIDPMFHSQHNSTSNEDKDEFKVALARNNEKNGDNGRLQGIVTNQPATNRRSSIELEFRK